MLKEKKISRTFEKIRNNFLSSTDVDIINQNRITRLGVVTKTILQLLVVCLFTMVGSYFINLYNFENNNNIKLISYGMLIFLSLFSFIVYIIGVNFVNTSKICSFLYSMINGLIIGILFYFLNIVYKSFYPFVFIALLTTFLVFIGMAYLYYKGIIQATPSFKQKMFFIFIIVIICEIVRLILFCIFGYTILQILAQSFLSIPISIFMIVFTSLILILHFDCLEQMMVSDMPQKYEWQISLGFVALFISIFLRVLELLLKIFGTRERD